MTMPVSSAPATQTQDIRFYQIASGKHVWYAITRGNRVAAATRDYGRACQYYAWERGIPRTQVGGPTHQVADAKALSVSLASQEQEDPR